MEIWTSNSNVIFGPGTKTRNPGPGPGPGPLEVLSATDKHFAFRKIHAGAKDRLSFKISHFAAQILRVDIQAMVLHFQEFPNISGRGKRYRGIQTGS